MDPLFGSETRARVLEALARMPRPMTAYRVAKVVGAEPIQVLRILKGLPDVAERTPEGWQITDPTLRRFLLERSRREAGRIRVEKDNILVRYGRRPRRRHAHH